MSARQLIKITAAQLERLAFNTRRDIEVDVANKRAFLTIDGTTYVAELTDEACS